MRTVRLRRWAARLTLAAVLGAAVGGIFGAITAAQSDEVIWSIRAVPTHSE